MFPFKKKESGQSALIKISGMHCTSCAMTIDGALEDLAGVRTSVTNYAKQITKVLYDPKRVSLTDIKKVIENLEYSIQE